MKVEGVLVVLFEGVLYALQWDGSGLRFQLHHLVPVSLGHR